MHLAPGNPIVFIADPGGGIPDPEYIDKMIEIWGLNKPLHEQLLIYLKNIITGNFGRSYKYWPRPVLDIIVERIPNTLLLMVPSVLIAFTSGVALGIASAKRPNSLFDKMSTSVSLMGFSIPSFWLGMVLLLVFAVQLQWFPIMGKETLGQENLTVLALIIDRVKHLILPTITLSAGGLAIYIRLTRASMLEELSKEYIITARGKGLDDRRVYYTHAFRNAMLPVITVFALNLAFMLAGAALVESIFGWPGIGSVILESISVRDYPVLMGIFIFISIAVLLANFLVDILYALLDPRIRYK